MAADVAVRATERAIVPSDQSPSNDAGVTIMQGRRRYYGSARLPRSQEWRMRGESTILLILRSARRPCRQVTLFLCRFGRTVIGSELMVEARELPTTSSGREHYPNGVAPTIPVECSSKPAGRLQQQVPPSLGSRAHRCANHRSTPQHGRGPDGKQPGARQSRAPLGARRLAERGELGAWLSVSLEWLSPLAAGRAAGICGTLHRPAHGQQIAVSWRSEGSDADAG